ncbi:unnamed protein product [Paramecium primaurelia]|uniref:Uncharacterized protein n=1 Tax=Paramecium primaurelia TaxID=5886 RepID=A0A8S1NLI0_PARPR|nr:unnamed protein product [Paramecium primaurelia]
MEFQVKLQTNKIQNLMNTCKQTKLIEIYLKIKKITIIQKNERIDKKCKVFQKNSNKVRIKLFL